MIVFKKNRGRPQSFKSLTIILSGHFSNSLQAFRNFSSDNASSKIESDNEVDTKVDDDTPATIARVDMFSAVTNNSGEETSYPTWYKRMRSKLTIGTGPAYLGQNTPFPYNPEFQPPKPLTDEFRNRLVEIWNKDPIKWTPRQLSQRFKISIERVKAIIKLKVLQSKMVQEGFKVNQKYVQKIESHLNASSPVVPEKNILEYDVTGNIPPKMVAIPDESKLSASEAAWIIGRKLRPIYAMVDEDLQGDLPYNPIPKKELPVDHSNLLIRNDTFEKSRWRYIFMDTSSGVTPESRKVFIREPNGDLRYADARERREEGKKVWAQQATRYIT